MDSTDMFLGGGNKKTPMIFAVSSLVTFILGVLTKNSSIIPLILFFVSFILSEIGIKQSKKYGSKVFKIINIILGVISILYFIIFLFNIIGTVIIRDNINDMWS